jgi:hypothetical protein
VIVVHASALPREIVADRKSSSEYTHQATMEKQLRVEVLCLQQRDFAAQAPQQGSVGVTWA